MSFVKKIAKSLKEGMEIEVNFFGVTYEGEIVELNTINVSDSSIILKEIDEDENEKHHLIPINSSTAFTVVVPEPEEDEEIVDDAEEYVDMSIPQLKELCKERSIDFRKNAKKKQLINLLEYDDEHPGELSDEKTVTKKKKKSSKKKSKKTKK